MELYSKEDQRLMSTVVDWAIDSGLGYKLEHLGLEIASDIWVMQELANGVRVPYIAIMKREDGRCAYVRGLSRQGWDRFKGIK